jgi:hypothetical protein
MRKHTRHTDGLYHIHGHKYSMLIGSRAQVAHGTAYKTAGGLIKSGIIKSKSSGNYVSKKASHRAKREDRLGKAGWGTVKGKFGAVRLDEKRKTQKKGKKSRRRK